MLNFQIIAKPSVLILFVLLFLSAFHAKILAQSEEEKETIQAISKGIEAFKNQDYATAVPNLAIAAKVLPDNPQIRYIYGVSLLARSKQVSNNDDARKMSSMALVEFLAAKKLGLKIEGLDEFIKLLGGTSDPNDTSISAVASPQAPPGSEAEKAMNRAEEFFAQSNYDEALKNYQKAFKLNPKIYNAALYSGDCYTQKSDWANAEIWYQKAIVCDPTRETAYRYSATPLMKQKLFDQALDRYIEAYITEPYNKMASGGISQWAQVTGAKLAHPHIDIPKVKFDQLGKATTDISADSSNPSMLAWGAYVKKRQEWNTSKFAADSPEEKSYRHSLKEEAEAIRAALKIAKDQKLTDEQFLILETLDNAGLLESFILLALADKGIALDHPAYLSTNRTKLHEYVKTYLVKK